MNHYLRLPKMKRGRQTSRIIAWFRRKVDELVFRNQIITSGSDEQRMSQSITTSDILPSRLSSEGRGGRRKAMAKVAITTSGPIEFQQHDDMDLEQPHGVGQQMVDPSSRFYSGRLGRFDDEHYLHDVTPDNM